MGILDLMLGNPSEGDGASMSNSIVLAKETHAFVHPIPVRRSEIDALEETLDALEAAPSLAENSEELEQLFDGFGDEAAIDVDDLVERSQVTQDAIEPMVETWREQVSDGIDLGVVYLPSGAEDDVRAFVTHCKQRSDQEHDEFELPEGFGAVVGLLKRIEDAAADQYRAVVHTDLVPPTE